jgi:hypothetical protein
VALADLQTDSRLLRRACKRIYTCVWKEGSAKEVVRNQSGMVSQTVTQQESEMTKNEVIKRFCELSIKVAATENYEHAADCFCEDALPLPTFDFSEWVVKFIEDAVDTKIAKQD